MKKGIFRRIAVCAVAMSLMASFSACGAKEEESAGTISVILKSQDTPQYWDVVANGAKEAGEELGYTIDVQAPPTEADINIQIDLINQAVANKADAIVLAPINLTDTNSAIQNAQEAGVTVLTIDSRADLPDLTYIGTDNEAAGAVAGRESKPLLTGSKKVAIIAISEGSATSQRASGFVSALCPEGEESDIKIVETLYCNADTATAKAQALTLIEKYPDLEMIYGVNQNAATGICEAIVELGIPGQIKVVGFDSSDQMIEYLEGGVINGFVVQNPYNIGYLGVRNAAKVLDGESIGLVIDTGATFISNDNLNDEAVQKLLYPLGKAE